MMQYIAVPQTVSGATTLEWQLFPTHNLQNFIMREHKVNSGPGQITRREVLSYHPVGGSNTTAPAGTVLAIINSSGHVTPICNETTR